MTSVCPSQAHAFCERIAAFETLRRLSFRSMSSARDSSALGGKSDMHSGTEESTDEALFDGIGKLKRGWQALALDVRSERESRRPSTHILFFLSFFLLSPASLPLSLSLSMAALSFSINNRNQNQKKNRGRRQLGHPCPAIPSLREARTRQGLGGGHRRLQVGRRPFVRSVPDLEA